MLKRLFIAVIAILLLHNINAQYRRDSIEVKKVFGGYKYQLNGISLTRGQLSEVIEKDQLAYPIMKKANANNTAATVIGAAGGLLIGIPIGTLIANRQPRWALAGVGGALALISLPFDIAFKKQTKAAVDTYNTNLTSSNSNLIKPSYNLAVNNGGLGLIVRF